MSKEEAIEIIIECFKFVSGDKLYRFRDMENDLRNALKEITNIGGINE